jgi:hypothetical protein
MSLFHKIGGRLVEDGELQFDLLKGNLSTFNLADVPNEFTAIGIGKPLSIDVRSIYLGEQPEEDWLNWGNQDLLVTSSVKGTEVYESAPRAVNYIRPNVAKYTTIRSIPASESGSFVLFYSPSLTKYATTVSCELGFTDDAEAILSQVGNLLGQAAGLPVFVPASTYLIAAGQLVKIATDVLKKLRAMKQPRQFTSQITLHRPGLPNTLAGYKILMPSYVPESTQKTLQQSLDIKDDIAIDRGTGRQYAGPVPLIVLAVDGATRNDLKDFQPTAASADVLERFFGKPDGGSMALSAISDGLKLYNDYTMRDRALDIKGRYDSESNVEEKAKLKEEYNAIIKNIREKAFALAPIP